MFRMWIETSLGTIHWLLYWLSGRRGSKDVRSSGRQACLNVGSAYQAPEGWVNLDRSIHVLIESLPFLPAILHGLKILNNEQYGKYRDGRWSRVRFWDVRYSLPFPDNTFDYIYSSHLLEHLAQGVVGHLLRECYRVLKPGGVLRLVVPDLYKAASEYVDTVRRLERADINDSETVAFLGEPVKVGNLTDRFVREILVDPDPIRQLVFGHAWMYDAWSLALRLRNLGFESVARKEYRRGSVPDLDLLDCRPLNSLHLESIKPSTRGLSTLGGRS